MEEFKDFDEHAREVVFKTAARNTFPGFHPESELGELALHAVSEHLGAQLDMQELEEESQDGDCENQHAWDNLFQESADENFRDGLKTVNFLDYLHNDLETGISETPDDEKLDNYELLVTESCHEMLDILNNPQGDMFRSAFDIELKDEEIEELENLVFEVGHLLMRDADQHFRYLMNPFSES